MPLCLSHAIQRMRHSCHSSCQCPLRWSPSLSYQDYMNPTTAGNEKINSLWRWETSKRRPIFIHLHQTLTPRREEAVVQSSTYFVLKDFVIHSLAVLRDRGCEVRLPRFVEHRQTLQQILHIVLRGDVTYQYDKLEHWSVDFCFRKIHTFGAVHHANSSTSIDNQYFRDRNCVGIQSAICHLGLD